MLSPEAFLANTIPPEVRNDPARRDAIAENLTKLNNAVYLTDSQQISAIYQRGLQDNASAARADTQAGIHNVCGFFNNIAIETNNRDLGNAAQLVSAGTQLYSAYSAFAAATAATATVATGAAAAAATGATVASSGASAAALVGPIGLGAVALFSIYSTLKRKKKNVDPFAEALMHSLGIISEQVNNVNNNVLAGFEQSFEYHRMTLELVSDGFRKINESQHALHYQTANMHINISNELRKLTWYVQSLGQTLTEGQETLSLRKFSELIETHKNISGENITEDTRKTIQKTAYKFAHWSKARGTASDPLYTGVKFIAYKPKSPSELYAIINQVINPLNPYNMIEWQGFLAYILKNQLNSGAAQNIDIDALFNPDLWIQSTSRYLRLRQENPALVLDADNNTLNSIIASAENQLAWEKEKRHSTLLFTSIFNLYENAVQKIEQILKEQMQLKIQALQIDISLPIDQLIAKFAGRMPLNPTCQGATSVTYYTPNWTVRAQQLGNDPTKVSFGGPSPLYDIDYMASWVNEVFGGYTTASRGQSLYAYPSTIEHPEFSIAERIGLINITAHQVFCYRQPTEPAAPQLLNSYISDSTYGLKTIIHGVETLIQHEAHVNTNNVPTSIQKTDIDNTHAIAQVRIMINNYIKEQKKAIIVHFFSNAQLNDIFKEEILAPIDASIRLLSAVMADWPEEMRLLMYNSLYGAPHIARYLTEDATHALPWQDLLNGINSPQFQDFKAKVLQATQNPENYFQDDEYLTAIKKLHQAACTLRENPPAATQETNHVLPDQNAVLAQVVAQQSNRIESLEAMINEMRQMQLYLIQQNGLLIQEVRRNNESPATGSPVLHASSPASSTQSSAANISNASIKNNGKKPPNIIQKNSVQ